MNQADQALTEARSDIDATREPDIADEVVAAEFDHEGWKVCIAMLRRSAQGCWTGQANLSRTGVSLCRIVLASRYTRRQDAIAALERKSREVIESWSTRDQRGQREAANS